MTENYITTCKYSKLLQIVLILIYLEQKIKRIKNSLLGQNKRLMLI